MKILIRNVGRLSINPLRRPTPPRRIILVAVADGVDDGVAQDASEGHQYAGGFGGAEPYREARQLGAVFGDQRAAGPVDRRGERRVRQEVAAPGPLALR